MIPKYFRLNSKLYKVQLAYRHKLSRICFAAMMSLISATPASAQFITGVAPAVGVAPDLAASIDAAIAPYFRPDAPGATLIVTVNGKTVFRKAYGMADLNTGTPMEAGTALRLGSLTKQFTATAVLILAEQGKLSVSDDIRQFLPEFPDKGRTITIENLLTHTSGIPSYTDDPGYLAGMAKDLTVTQMIGMFKDAPLQFAPGERFAYSNSGYFLLGAIIERVSGMRYADFIAKTIFEPLGMRHSAYAGNKLNSVTLAHGYRSSAGRFAPAAPLSMTQPFAAGALVSPSMTSPAGMPPSSLTSCSSRLAGSRHLRHTS